MKKTTHNNGKILNRGLNSGKNSVWFTLSANSQNDTWRWYKRAIRWFQSAAIGVKKHAIRVFLETNFYHCDNLNPSSLFEELTEEVGGGGGGEEEEEEEEKEEGEAIKCYPLIRRIEEDFLKKKLLLLQDEHFITCRSYIQEDARPACKSEFSLRDSLMIQDMLNCRENLDHKCMVHACLIFNETSATAAALRERIKNALCTTAFKRAILILKQENHQKARRFFNFWMRLVA